METEVGDVYEWRLENLSHWCAEVHGHCIRSPVFYCYPLCPYMELYPKGIGSQGEHLVVRLCDIKDSFSGELSFHSSDGSLLCSKQQVNDEEETYHLELPPGPKFEDVLSRIRESEDFIAVKLVHGKTYCVQRACTTVNVLKISVKINPRWVETIRSGETKKVCSINLLPYDCWYDNMNLSTCLENDIVNFVIDPPEDKDSYPFAVVICMSLMGSDDIAVNCLKNKHLFRKRRPWTFPDPLQKKELVGKEISLFLCVKTKNLIQSPSYVNWDKSNVSVELNKTLCFSEKAPSTVLTKDSGTQTYVTSELAYDSVLVLSKELICVYQDQKFSDLVLKCDNVTFPVHKVIMIARSPVFDRLLSSDMKEAASGTVEIGDLDPSTLCHFLTYLYTGAIEEELQFDRTLKLYYAADKYQVSSLKKDCSRFLCANVSISKVSDILSLADRHSDDQLTSTAHDFILNNYNDVLKSNEWESFMCKEPLLAVKTLTIVSVSKHDSK